MRRVIDTEIARDMVCNADSDLVNCRISDLDGFYDCGNGELESGDWFEGEGAAELVVDTDGNVLRFDGYYQRMDSNGNWTEC